MAFDGWCPFAEKLPISTREYSEVRIVPLISVVEHITDGDDSRGWLQHADNQSSVHFLIREEMRNGVLVGVIYQFMPITWAAWGNGRTSPNNPFMPSWAKAYVARGININHATVSVEHERNWPFSTMMDGPMLEASLRLHKWLASVAPTIKRNREYIIGHFQIDHITRAHCPGGVGGALFPFDQIIQAMQSPGLPAPVVTPAAPKITPTPFHRPVGNPFDTQIGGAIADFWMARGSLEIFGWPITDELNEVLEDRQEYKLQRFEKTWLHWRADQGVKVANLGLKYNDLERQLATFQPHR